MRYTSTLSNLSQGKLNRYRKIEAMRRKSRTPGFKAMAPQAPMQLLALPSDLVADEKTLHPNVSLMSYHHPDVRCCSQLKRATQTPLTMCNPKSGPGQLLKGTSIAPREARLASMQYRRPLSSLLHLAPRPHATAAAVTLMSRSGRRSRGALSEISCGLGFNVNRVRQLGWGAV